MNGIDFIGYYCNKTMSVRPEFYSGCGANTTDLNSTILESIYKGLVKEKGETAAKRFVNLVDGIKVLSATGFLNAFYSWYGNDCPEIEDTDPTDMDIPVGGGSDSDTTIGVGMATIGSMMSRGDRDQTVSVKREFIRAHCKELNHYDETAGSYGFYDSYSNPFGPYWS